jgi:hypothetical protein
MSALDGIGITPSRMLFVILVSTSLLYGCAVRRQVPLNPTLPESTKRDKLPITIGIYYKPEFRNYKYAHANYRAEVGHANLTLFNKALAAMFQRPVEIPQLPSSSAAARAVDVVIEPTIEEFDNAPIEIIYRFNLYTSAGVKIASWTVPGGRRSPVPF